MQLELLLLVQELPQLLLEPPQLLPLLLELLLRQSPRSCQR